jgi:hypothetical protein
LAGLASLKDLSKQELQQTVDAKIGHRDRRGRGNNNNPERIQKDDQNVGYLSMKMTSEKYNGDDDDVARFFSSVVPTAI